ncbi:FixH family protein [Marinobacter salinisoli]|uniref:FixH family protein n=1 Tax=Marinobacter salinisoli TaxID=2769486 RepID=A0ABX7MNB4_9GAMM|nr:FixH family protein [Marinobacter salinisoli]QSP93574.1 FixH family protein [Marinobacter salinisoli]
MSEQTPIAPWYRQPWFWFLTIFPLAAIIWCTVMITVAMNLEDTMVTDDYSKQGRGINFEIARDQKATDMGLEAELSFSGRHVALTLEADQEAANFDYLILNLFHPTLSKHDRTLQFRSIGNGKYEGQLLEDIDGRWYFDLRGPDNQWRLKGEAWLPSDSLSIQAKGTDQE